MKLAVGNDELTVTATRKAKITTTLLLPEGPLRLRNVQYLVFDEEMSEVLMSRPLLNSLGFNLEQNLARVRDKYNNGDFSAVGFDAAEPALKTNTGKLARLLQKSESNLYGSSHFLDDEPTNQQSLSDDDVYDSNSLDKLGNGFIPEDMDHTLVSQQQQNLVEKATSNGLP